MRTSVILRVALGVVLVSGSFALGVFVPRPAAEIIASRRRGEVDRVSKQDEYSFINRSVVENIGKHFIINFKPLRENIEKIQKKYPQKTYIYFSYFNNGGWIGLNEREEFTAASTLKVPLAMALLKAVEERKVRLTDPYSLEESDLNDGFGSLYKSGTGRELTLEDLLSIMLQQSDNTAMNALIRVLQRIGIDDPLGGVYGFLGWDFEPNIPELGQAPDYSKINLKTLANIFVALYDAKYVDIDHSNKILHYLSQTPFDSQIVAGVPTSVAVSHKIGVSISDETFSDCGIVYAPNRNYLLCMGSNGGDEARASAFMAEVSRAVYDYVINN